jgi:hypothetical protein
MSGSATLSAQAGPPKNTSATIAAKRRNPLWAGVPQNMAIAFLLDDSMD